MKLVILGAGGHAKVVADCARVMDKFEQIMLLDDGYPNHPGIAQWPVIGTLNQYAEFAEDAMFLVAIGDNHSRKKWQQELERNSLPMATLVHPSAILGSQVELGEGSVVLAGAVLNILSKIGKGCIINTGASVDHDCHLANYVHVAPGTRLAGNVRLHDCVFMGVASAAIPGLSVGANATIGAGSTVLKDVPPGVTVVGSPARIINNNIEV